MKNKSITGALLLTIATTTIAFAQQNGGQFPPQPQTVGEQPQGIGRPMLDDRGPGHRMGGNENEGRGGGFFDRFFGRPENRQDENNGRWSHEGKMGDRMDEGRSWMMNASGTATRTMPWQNKGDERVFGGPEMQKMRDDMRAKMISPEVIAAIALKLGVSTSSIQAKIASGTTLREIVGDKISKEDLAKIIPPMPMGTNHMMGSNTNATSTYPFEDRRPRGLFNSLRAKLFGDDRPQENNGNGPEGQPGMNGDEGQGNDFGPIAPIRNIFRKIFNF